MNSNWSYSVEMPQLFIKVTVYLESTSTSTTFNVDNKAQDYGNFSALVMELLQSCAKPVSWLLVLWTYVWHIELLITYCKSDGYSNDEQ